MNTKPLFLFISAALIGMSAHAQEAAIKDTAKSIAKDTAALYQRIALLKPAAATLDSVYDDDLYYRSQLANVAQKYGPQSKQMDSLWRKRAKSDAADLARVKKIVQTYGWLSIDEVGEKANTAIFLVIQHADTTTQGLYLPVMDAAVKAGKAKREDLAVLQDKVLCQRGQRQLYGSQLRTNKAGKYEFFPIADEKNVDKRRASMGMEPLEQYAQNFGLDYHLPAN